MTERHEELWAAVPPDAEPEQFALRRAFLLGAVRPGQEVLDLGCGAGQFSAALLGAGTRPVAVDVAHEALRRAGARSAGLQRHHWVEGQPLPLGDTSVDVVWAGEVIEHVCDLAPWLSEVRRVLRPRGELLLTTPHHGPARLMLLALGRRRFAGHFDPLADHVRFFSAGTLRALLDDFGFDVLTLRGAGGVPGLRSTLLVRARRG